MYDTPGPGFPNTFQTKFSKKYGTREFIAAGIRNAHRRPEIFTSNQTEHRLPLRNRRESYIERDNKRENDSNFDRHSFKEIVNFIFYPIVIIFLSHNFLFSFFFLR